MVKFVCPESGCEHEFSNGSSSVISKAINHMQEMHGREVSRDYVKGNIDAHGD